MLSMVHSPVVFCHNDLQEGTQFTLLLSYLNLDFKVSITFCNRIFAVGNLPF